MHTNVISTSREAIFLFPSFLRSFLLCDSQLLFSRSLSDVPYAFLSARSIGWRARVSNPVTMRPNIGYRIMHLLPFRAIETTSMGREREREGPIVAGVIEIVRRSKLAKTFPSVDVAARGNTGSAAYPWNDNEFLDKGYTRPPLSERAKRNASFHSWTAKKRNAIALLAG